MARPGSNQRRGDEPTLEAALRYARRGWKIFPARIKPKKMSYVAGLREGGPRWGMTSDPALIREYWERWPRARIGLPTGMENGIFVADADTLAGHRIDGVGNFARMCEARGGLPATRTSRSPTGSLHWFFRHPVVLRVRSSASAIAPGVDVKGDGGMVIVPPSVGLRGGRYEWTSAEDAGEAEAPAWLLDLVTEPAREEVDLGSLVRAPVELDEVKAALEAIPNDSPDWAFWCRVGMATYSATGGSDEGFELFDRWSRRWQGYDEGDTRRKWHQELARSPPSRISVASLFYMADSANPSWRARQAAQQASGPADQGRAGVSLSDFRAYAPMGMFIYVPSREMWSADTVNAKLGKIPLLDRDGQPMLDEDGKPRKVPASTWLHQRRAVEMMTWAPGMPMVVQDRLIFEGGWIDRRGVSTFNSYQPPRAQAGDSTLAGPWVSHVRRIYPTEADHIIAYLAHRVQRPQEKINHALVLIGRQGIGKDTMLEPAKHAVGPWNFAEVGPHDVLAQFNPFLRSVILRISEARDLGDVNRYQLYERMKVICASPPDVLRVNEKFIRAHYVFNCCGVIITTNRQDGLYIEADDRRHFVADSERSRGDFTEAYWNDLWDFLLFQGGNGHVAAYLRTLDLSGFNAKAPPRQTEAFWRIVEMGRPHEDASIMEALMRLGSPEAFVKDDLDRAARDMQGDLFDWLSDKKNRRTLSNILEELGYVTFRNNDEARGLWSVDGGHKLIYVRSSLSQEDRKKAARNRQNRGLRVIDGGRADRE